MENIQIEHFYHTIGEDWFSYPNLYASIVSQFPSGSHLVEVGSWKGRSASFMAVEIHNSGKNMRFDCVDTWEGSEEHKDPDSQWYSPVLNEKDALYNIFLENTARVKHIINPIRMTSIDASKLYEDNSLEFVFIDAAHDYENVKLDIQHWYPKVKTGGILAGHDMWSNLSPVYQAVSEELPMENVLISEGCWLYRKIS